MSGEETSTPNQPVRHEEALMSRPKKSLFHDLSALRLDGTGTSSGAVEVITHVPVRKPNRHEFVRVHPEFILGTTVFTDKEERESYLVTPVMRSALVGEARPVLLVLAISRQNALFIPHFPDTLVWH